MFPRIHRSIRHLQHVQGIMRTLFVLSVITVAALGQMPNSCVKIKPEDVSTSLRTLENMYKNETTTALQLQTLIMSLQYSQDQISRNEYLSNSARILQSMYDNIHISSARLYSYLMTLQYDQEYDDPKITENLSSSIRLVESMCNFVKENVFQLNSHFMTQQNSWNSQERKLFSCVAVRRYDVRSGIHTLFLDDNKTLDVYCDQDTDGGGWMVIQRRQDGSVDFYRNWAEYERGFGNMSTEFWIGLANLYRLTKNKNFELRVELKDFDGSTAYAIYNTFNISGPEDYYRLNIGRYRGTAGDSLTYHNNMRFSTPDNDQDTDSTHCAQNSHGAWWYKSCLHSNLNGRYNYRGASGVDSMHWYHFRSDRRSLKRVEMKIKQ